VASKPDTWMPLYIADYLRKTMHLTRDQHGGYMLLLMACWDRGGRLPNDPSQLAGIARATSAEWRKLAPVLLPFFDDDGAFLTQDRVIEEHQKAARLSETRRQAGQQGGRPRKQTETETESTPKPNAFANIKQTETHAGVRSSPSPSPTEEGPNGPVGSKAPGKSEVGLAWAAASRKGRERSSRGDVERALKAAINRGHTAERVIAGLEAYFASPDATKDGGEYAKGAHRMIENDRWMAYAPAAGARAEATIDAPSEVRQRAWMGEFQAAANSWRPERGPEPGEPGCRVSPEIQREFGVEPAKPQPVERMA
jgi:uncharacterized protein YdaU (DUF1376 family)